MDQRICIKFCVKNKIKCADAFRMLTVAYGEATLDRSNVYRWYKMFSEGREDVNDEERAGRPSTSTTDENIDEVKKIVLANRRITVREVAEDLNISIGSCHSIFTNDLGMRRVAAKFVPKLLNFDQKQHREFLAKNNTLMPQPPYSPDLAPSTLNRSNVYRWYKMFSEGREDVNDEERAGRPSTSTTDENIDEVKKIVLANRRITETGRREIFLHHDNAPAHTSLLVREFLAKNNTLMMPQPPYSPDLAPCDFFLFPKLKRPMNDATLRLRR
ncbi:SETMR methyltransferase, partial [Acromyrmex charruanus]